MKKYFIILIFLISFQHSNTKSKWNCRGCKKRPSIPTNNVEVQNFAFQEPYTGNLTGYTHPIY